MLFIRISSVNRGNEVFFVLMVAAKTIPGVRQEAPSGRCYAQQAVDRMDRSGARGPLSPLQWRPWQTINQRLGDGATRGRTIAAVGVAGQAQALGKLSGLRDRYKTRTELHVSTGQDLRRGADGVLVLPW